MMQGFVLRCIVTGSAYKNDLDGKIEKFYSCITSPSKPFNMHFRLQCKLLYHTINQPQPCCTYTQGNYSVKNKPMVQI